MNKCLLELENRGCDIKGALRRMIDDEEFLIDCIETVLNDSGYDKLKELIEEKSVQEAFNCAHSLKGIVSNVGLTPMFKVLSDIVEILRAGGLNGVDRLFAVLIDKKNDITQIFNEYR